MNSNNDNKIEITHSNQLTQPETKSNNLTFDDYFQRLFNQNPISEKKPNDEEKLQNNCPQTQSDLPNESINPIERQTNTEDPNIKQNNSSLKIDESNNITDTKIIDGIQHSNSETPKKKRRRMKRKPVPPLLYFKDDFKEITYKIFEKNIDNDEDEAIEYELKAPNNEANVFSKFKTYSNTNITEILQLNKNEYENNKTINKLIVCTHELNRDEELKSDNGEKIHIATDVKSSITNSELDSISSSFYIQEIAETKEEENIERHFFSSVSISSASSEKQNVINNETILDPGNIILEKANILQGFTNQEEDHINGDEEENKNAKIQSDAKQNISPLQENIENNSVKNLDCNNDELEVKDNDNNKTHQSENENNGNSILQTEKEIISNHDNIEPQEDDENPNNNNNEPIETRNNPNNDNIESKEERGNPNNDNIEPTKEEDNINDKTKSIQEEEDNFNQVSNTIAPTEEEDNRNHKIEKIEEKNNLNNKTKNIKEKDNQDNDNIDLAEEKIHLNVKPKNIKEEDNQDNIEPEEEDNLNDKTEKNEKDNTQNDDKNEEIDKNLDKELHYQSDKEKKISDHKQTDSDENDTKNQKSPIQTPRSAASDKSIKDKKAINSNDLSQEGSINGSINRNKNEEIYSKLEKDNQQKTKSRKDSLGSDKKTKEIVETIEDNFEKIEHETDKEYSELAISKFDHGSEKEFGNKIAGDDEQASSSSGNQTSLSSDRVSKQLNNISSKLQDAALAEHPTQFAKLNMNIPEKPKEDKSISSPIHSPSLEISSFPDHTINYQLAENNRLLSNISTQKSNLSVLNQSNITPITTPRSNPNANLDITPGNQIRITETNYKESPKLEIQLFSFDSAEDISNRNKTQSSKNGDVCALVPLDSDGVYSIQNYDLYSPTKKVSKKRKRKGRYIRKKKISEFTTPIRDLSNISVPQRSFGEKLDQIREKFLNAPHERANVDLCFRPSIREIAMMQADREFSNEPMITSFSKLAELSYMNKFIRETPKTRNTTKSIMKNGEISPNTPNDSTSKGSPKLSGTTPVRWIQ